jgi:hypothetical protein
VADGIRVDPAAFDHLSEAFRDADKVVRRRVTKALRDVAKPVGADVIRKGSTRLPSRGGLADRVATRGRVSTSMSSSRSSPKATISLSNREGIKLAGLDAGLVRHPVYGRLKGRGSWVSQDIPKRAFSDAFESNTELDKVRDEVFTAMTAALREIAADAKH